MPRTLTDGSGRFLGPSSARTSVGAGAGPPGGPDIARAATGAPSLAAGVRASAGTGMASRLPSAVAGGPAVGSLDGLLVVDAEQAVAQQPSTSRSRRAPSHGFISSRIRIGLPLLDRMELIEKVHRGDQARADGLSQHERDRVRRSAPRYRPSVDRVHGIPAREMSRLLLSVFRRRVPRRRDEFRRRRRAVPVLGVDFEPPRKLQAGRRGSPRRSDVGAQEVAVTPGGVGSAEKSAPGIALSAGSAR
jgi:hypothetical protein